MRCSVIPFNMSTFLGFDAIDLTLSPEELSPIIPLSDSFADFVPSEQFNINSFQDFLYYNPDFLKEYFNFSDYSLPSNPFVNIPDVVSDCLSINDFLRCTDYIPTSYSIHQFLIDYIYFLENLLCSLEFDSSVLFQTFLAFQASQHLYELNQLNYLQNIFPEDFSNPTIPIPSSDSSLFVPSGDTSIPDQFGFDFEELERYIP